MSLFVNLKQASEYLRNHYSDNMARDIEGVSKQPNYRLFLSKFKTDHFFHLNHEKE